VTLSTFGDLKTAVADWLERTDLTSAIANDFFPITQSKMYLGDRSAGMQDIEPLRIRAMVSTGTLTPATGGTITIATDVSANWLEFIELTPTYSGAQSIDYMEPWSFRKRVDAISSTVAPQWIYTVEGGIVYLAPAAISTIRAAWYAKFTALSGSGDTDWIILNAPQVYLYGCLAEACAYLQDDRLPQFRAMFAGAIKALNMNDQMQRASGSKPVARPRTVA